MAADAVRATPGAALGLDPSRRRGAQSAPESRALPLETRNVFGALSYDAVLGKSTNVWNA